MYGRFLNNSENLAKIFLCIKYSCHCAMIICDKLFPLRTKDD